MEAILLDKEIKDFTISLDPTSCVSKEYTRRIMNMVAPYFLSAYKIAPWIKAKREILGEEFVVHRPNHGLAHSLRQSALAKEIFLFLTNYSISDTSGIVGWAKKKLETDPLFLQKIEMAAAFQRSGRESECSSSSDPALYKTFEMQDTIYFQTHAEKCPLFTEQERLIFAEAILWSNPGKLDENQSDDLKYLRRVFHASHTLDLRRIPSFDGDRIQKDAMDQLFGCALPENVETVKNLLWNRSGRYLLATGDTDLAEGRNHYQDEFFLQTRNPYRLVEAIHQVFTSVFADSLK